MSARKARGSFDAASLALALGGLGVLLWASRSKSAQEWGPEMPAGSFDFAYLDDRYLAAGESNGGRAMVPLGASEPAPLLVYLHGNNESGVLHRGFGGGSRGDNDVRTMAPPGWIVAGPSQTRGAKGSSLWAGFDLDAFVAAVEQATGRQVDRERVVLAGHSGAGCTVGGGLLSKFGDIKPAKVVVIDVCMNPPYGSLYAEQARAVPLEVYYQPFTWTRDFAGFEKLLSGLAKVERITGPFTGNAHEQIVPLALGRALA